MRSDSFINACKNALIKILKESYNEIFDVQDIHLVSYSKSLLNHKCTMCDLNNNGRYYEITYNGIKCELYIDIYQKQSNTLIELKDLDVL